LFDALDRGFCSVEADIHLDNGQLLVEHDRSQVRPERTLEALFLEPLRERVEANGGRVYPAGPTFTLLIDIKSNAEQTYPVLRDLLRRYDRILTRFYRDRTETNAVTVIVSGNRPRAMMLAESVRYIGYDGRLEDSDASMSRHFMPLISDNWPRHFKWKGIGPLPEVEREKLRALARRAHEQGKRLRFWGAPDKPSMWAELEAAGVDLINTDDLEGLENHLRQGGLNKLKPER
jgi:hypothetical protein